MNRDDILRMAREAGLVLCGDGLFDAKPEELERFATRVAAAEREACARVAEMTPYKRVAAAIRARKA